MSDDNETGQHPERKSVRGAVKAMPRWKKTLIGVSLVLALVGGGAQIAGAIGGRNVKNEATTEVAREAPPPPPSVPPGTSGFVATGTNETAAEPEAAAPPPSTLQRMAPQL